MKYALVNADGLVTGVILWDGQVDYTPADGLTLEQVPNSQPCGPGWTYNGTDWIAPPPAEDEEEF